MLTVSAATANPQLRSSVTVFITYCPGSEYVCVLVVALLVPIKLPCSLIVYPLKVSTAPSPQSMVRIPCPFQPFTGSRKIKVKVKTFRISIRKLASHSPGSGTSSHQSGGCQTSPPPCSDNFFSSLIAPAKSCASVSRGISDWTFPSNSQTAFQIGRASCRERV